MMSTGCPLSTGIDVIGNRAGYFTNELNKKFLLIFKHLTFY